MNAETRERCLRAIAFLAEQIRIETGAQSWNYHGILGALHRGEAQDRSIPEIARAALWFAQHRTKQDTPLMLAEDGAHWRLHEKQDEPALPPPPPRLHSQNLGPIPTRTRIQEIRQQARQGDPK